MKVEIERDVSHLQKKMLQEQRRIKLRRLFRNRLSMLGAIIVLLMIIIAVAAPLIAPQDLMPLLWQTAYCRPVMRIGSVQILWVRMYSVVLFMEHGSP